MRTEPGTNRRLTLLDCELGGHTGHFTISRVEIDGKLVWACGNCIALSARAA